MIASRASFGVQGRQAIQDELPSQRSYDIVESYSENKNRRGIGGVEYSVFFPRLTLLGVTTHRPNALAMKMDGAQAYYPYIAANVETMRWRVGRRGGQ